jgi:LDH2 family malate/lactate/ureidoglycolate dehydrogenase
VEIPALHGCMLEIFDRVGMQAEYAEHIVAVLLDSELRGHDHHGVHLVRYVTTEIQRGVLSAAPNVTLLRETGSTLLMDGDRGIVTPALQAMRWCVDHAHAGVAIEGVRNCQPVALGFYVRVAAEAGMLGFAYANAVPSVAPSGGRTATIGTNPLAYGAPTGHHGPIVFDASMTAIAGMAVQLAAEDGRTLPDGVLLDSDGRPTTDPAARALGGLMAPLGYPHAAHKGFSLALMVEVLAGGLTGAAVGRELIAAPGTFGCTFSPSTRSRLCPETSSAREWMSWQSKSNRPTAPTGQTSCSCRESAASADVASLSLGKAFRSPHTPGVCSVPSVHPWA